LRKRASAPGRRLVSQIAGLRRGRRPGSASAPGRAAPGAPRLPAGRREIPPGLPFQVGEHARGVRHCPQHAAGHAPELARAGKGDAGEYPPKLVPQPLHGVRLRRADGEARELDLAPAFRLTDQQGRAVSLADWRGRAVLLDFIYTHCPGPCPILTARHVELQRTLPLALRARVHFASISLDPQRDTPEALRAYAEARGADLSDWSFLTGPAEEISAVLRAYGIGAGRNGGGEIEHLVATFLINPEGRITRRFLGLEHSTKTLQTALQRAAS